jgi:hypothetical protein
VTEEWVYWADEEFINLSGQGGRYPKLHRSRYPIKFTKVYYCYYVPQGRKCTSFFNDTILVLYSVLVL